MVKLICEELKKPVHEVIEWPEWELGYWEAFFDINIKKDKPMIKVTKPKQTPEETAKALDQILR